MELGSCRRNQWGRAVERKRAWKAREILREAEMSQCQLQPRDFGAEIFSAHIMSTEETWAWPSSRRGPAPLNKLLIAHLADDVGACDIQHVHVECLHRTCSNLVPFGSSGDFGSEHSSLRTLVYVPRGRQCPRRAGHSRCDSTRAVVAHAKLAEVLALPCRRVRRPTGIAIRARSCRVVIFLKNARLPPLEMAQLPAASPHPPFHTALEAH